MINKNIAFIIAIVLSAQSMVGITQVEPGADQVLVQYASVQPATTSPVILNRVQVSAIENHKSTLKNELFYKNITRVGAKSLAVLAMAYMLYSSISPWLNQPERPAIVPGVIPADIGTRVDALWDKVSPSFFSLQWFKNNGAYIANSLVVGTVASAGASVIGDFNKAVMHPDSLEWFVQNKTNLFDLLPFQMDPRSLMNGFPMDLQMHMMMLKNQDRIKKSTIEELREYLSALEAFDSISQENKAMSIYFIQSTCNSMVSSLELILGFMALKQDQAPEALATEIGSHINYIVHSINTFCTKLEVTLEDSAIDYLKKKQECVSALSSLKGELHRVCMRFVAIEREQRI